MIVYNGINYIDYAIRSIKDFVDEFIVIEGAFKITINKGGAPRSNDGTIDVLKKYEKSGDIILRHANLQEHKYHYDIGYQYAVENGSDWAILIDADEIWTPQATQIANIAMKKHINKPSCELRVQEYSFVNDFWHHYPSSYPRIFKCQQGAYFIFDNEVKFPNDNRGKHPTYMLPGKHIWHYGYVQRKKYWRLKQDYMYEKDKNPLNLKYKLEGDSYILPEDIPIYTYTGKHPDIMKSHPFHDMTAHDIIYGECI